MREDLMAKLQLKGRKVQTDLQTHLKLPLWKYPSYVRMTYRIQGLRKREGHFGSQEDMKIHLESYSLIC